MRIDIRPTLWKVVVLGTTVAITIGYLFNPSSLSSLGEMGLVSMWASAIAIVLLDESAFSQ